MQNENINCSMRGGAMRLLETITILNINYWKLWRNSNVSNRAIRKLHNSEESLIYELDVRELRDGMRLRNLLSPNCIYIQKRARINF
jgi:hypothetical protein